VKSLAFKVYKALKAALNFGSATESFASHTFLSFNATSAYLLAEISSFVTYSSFFPTASFSTLIFFIVSSTSLFF